MMASALLSGKHFATISSARLQFIIMQTASITRTTVIQVVTTAVVEWLERTLHSR